MRASIFVSMVLVRTAWAMPPVPAPGPRGYDLIDYSRHYDKLVVARTGRNKKLVKELSVATRLDGRREVSVSVIQHLSGSSKDRIETVKWDFGYLHYGGGLGFTPDSLYLLALGKRQGGARSVIAFLSKRLDKLPPSHGLQIRLVPTKELSNELDKKAKAAEADANTRIEADAARLKQHLKGETPKKKEGQ